MRTTITIQAQGLIPWCSSMLWFPRNVKTVAQPCQAQSPSAFPKSISLGILLRWAYVEGSLWGDSCVFLCGGFNHFSRLYISQSCIKLPSINNQLPFTPNWSHLSDKAVGRLGHTSATPLTCSSIDCLNSPVGTLITHYLDENWISGEIQCPQMAFIFNLKGQGIGFCSTKSGLMSWPVHCGQMMKSIWTTWF